MARWNLVLVFLFCGCDPYTGAVLPPGAPVLRAEPAELDVLVELDAPSIAPFRVFDGEADITRDVELAIHGRQLGRVEAGGFTSDGRTGGRAIIVARYREHQVLLPVRVKLHSTRGAPDGIDAAPVVTVAGEEAALEPGDGAVLPRNLGRLDLHFLANANDSHDITISGPDLELRVWGQAAEGARTVELTTSEWDALSRTSRGGSVDVVVRTGTPTAARQVSARLSIAELPFANEVLFTGRMTGETLPQMWSYQLTRGTTERWASGPNGNCMGCHVAVSRDGKHIAAGGTVDGATGPIFGGVVIDAQTRYYSVPPSTAVGSWISAAFDPSGAMVTAANGVLTVREAGTALPRTTLAQGMPANQPAISPAGRWLAYVGGPIDPATTNPSTEELFIHTWDAATTTLGPARTLVAKRAGEFLKLPDFSPDDRWVVYSRLPAIFKSSGSIMVIRSDGSGAPVELTGGQDDFGRFASEMGPGPEPMVWIMMKSYRSVGPRDQARIGQLWAMAFYPERGVASRPFHLPGQRSDVAVLHAPIALTVP